MTVSPVRRLLSAPFVLLRWISVAFHFLIGFLQIGLRWLDLGNRDHVWWPIVVAVRMVQGRPIWQARDLVSGIQPRSARALELARADPTVLELRCACDSKKCRVHLPAARRER